MGSALSIAVMELYRDILIGMRFRNLRGASFFAHEHRGITMEKKVFTLLITPPGWDQYGLEDMVRAAVWVVRRFDGSNSVSVLGCSIRHNRLSVDIETGEGEAEVDLPALVKSLTALAAIPLSPCACGCGVDLSITECVRDALEAVKSCTLQQAERKLVSSGDLQAAIRVLRERTGVPMADAKGMVAEYLAAVAAVARPGV